MAAEGTASSFQEAFIRFLHGVATSQTLEEVNISAGIALQELGEIAPDPEAAGHLR